MRCGAGPVGVTVIHVSEILVIGVSMNRSHQPLLYTDRLMQGFGDRCQAVSGARGVGDDLISGGQCGVVDTVDHGGVHAVTGGRHQHAFGAGRQVLASALTLCKQPGTFQNNVDPKFAPGQSAGIPFRENADPVSAHQHILTVY